MYAYRPKDRRRTRETREEKRTTERKRKIINLAYLADHRISILLSVDLILTF